MKGRKRFAGGFVLLLLPALLVLAAWTRKAEGQAHYTPEYEQVDLSAILEKETLSDEEYDILVRQTGLARAGVDELRENGREEELLLLQQRFFAEVEYECRRSFLIFRSERIVSEETRQSEDSGLQRCVADGAESVNGTAAYAFLPVVQNGDILISFSGHFFGWRCGHAGIVINAEEGQTLEAVALGSDSKICSLEHWEEYPCFALLRLKNATQEERDEIAAYAADHLEGIPYEILSFCKLQTEEKGVRDFTAEPETEDGGSPSGTQCAHLVWLAYAHFGFDLDSDGGYIVTPSDIYGSGLLEVVQIYGLSPDL